MKTKYIGFFVALVFFPCFHSKTFNVEQQFDSNGKFKLLYIKLIMYECILSLIENRINSILT